MHLTEIRSVRKFDMEKMTSLEQKKPGSHNARLARIIEKSTQDLHDRVNMQQHLLLTLLGQVKEGCPLDLCPLVDCPHRRLLCRVLTETIEVLEETKKAFKSKKLEGLRRRLMDILREAA
jgi:hypothetical protein